MSRHQVVAGLLVDDGAVLHVLRSADRRWFPGVWDLPGGHVEPGEEPHDELRFLTPADARHLPLADTHLLPAVERILAAEPGPPTLVE